jgi:hypothetical protein
MGHQYWSVLYSAHRVNCLHSHNTVYKWCIPKKLWETFLIYNLCLTLFLLFSLWPELNVFATFFYWHTVRWRNDTSSYDFLGFKVILTMRPRTIHPLLEGGGGAVVVYANIFYHYPPPAVCGPWSGHIGQGRIVQGTHHPRDPSSKDYDPRK